MRTVCWSHACFCNSPSEWILKSEDVCVCVYALECTGWGKRGSKWWSTSLRPSSTTFPVSACAACQTLVMEARQFDDFWSFSGCVVGGSGMARKLNGSPMLLVPMWPGLSAGFCRLLLSTMLDVLDARLSRVLHRKQDAESEKLKYNRDKNVNIGVWMSCLKSTSDTFMLVYLHSIIEATEKPDGKCSSPSKTEQ